MQRDSCLFTNAADEFRSAQYSLGPVNRIICVPSRTIRIRTYSTSGSSAPFECEIIWIGVEQLCNCKIIRCNIAIHEIKKDKDNSKRSYKIPSLAQSCPKDSPLLVE